MITNNDLTKLNYDKLMAHDPSVYCSVTSDGEEFQLVEHPLKGDEYPVIILHHPTKQAVCSDFWDTDDLEGDYKPILVDGNIEIILP